MEFLNTNFRLQIVLIRDMLMSSKVKYISIRYMKNYGDRKYKNVPLFFLLEQYQQVTMLRLFDWLFAYLLFILMILCYRTLLYAPFIFFLLHTYNLCLLLEEIKFWIVAVNKNKWLLTYKQIFVLTVWARSCGCAYSNRNIWNFHLDGL